MAEIENLAGKLADHRTARLLVRSAIGGWLMGLANLVPGISGGTMLLAAGIYPDFISAVAEITTFRFRKRSVVLLGTVVLAVGLAILFFAGPVRSLVIDHRWVMYSLFIGLTLGGAPLVWQMAKPLEPAVGWGILGGFLLMFVMAVGLGQGTSETSAAGGVGGWILLLFSGLAGASAMILPGVSGGYLLLLLGQYERILGAVDQVKIGFFGTPGGAGADMALMFQAFDVVIPVGIGVLMGIVGVSNLLKWLLGRFEKATLGVLMGLLLGAVIGLWPFQAGKRPILGEIFNGNILTPQNLAGIDPADWPLEFFSPNMGQIFAAILLIAGGFAVTLLVARMGKSQRLGGGDLRTSDTEPAK